MTLQQEMTEKIDHFVGIEQLTKNLEKFRASTTEKKWFDNMIFYFNSLYSQIVDVEGHAIEFYDASMETIAFLEDFNKERNDQTIAFLIDLITFKLAAISGLRKIS